MMAYLVDRNTGCWIWQRAKTSAGYGEIGQNGKQQYAHRVYYERTKGPIPRGYVIDHLCQNPSCVNPKHLEAVKQYVNCWRGKKSKLSPQLVAKIRQFVSQSHLSYGEIGNRFGVSATCILSAIKGTRWGNVPGKMEKLGRRRLIDLRKTSIKTLKEIMTLCKLKNGTQRSIAKQFGLSESYVSQISNGYYASCLS